MGLYFHSVTTWVAVFLSIVVSMMVLVDCNTRGTRQGHLKHAPKTRPIALLSMANVACIVFYSGTFSIAYQQPCKPGEHMSRCNTWPVGGCVIQSMAVQRSQQWLSCNIQHMGETLQGPTQKVRVEACRGNQGCIPCSSFCCAYVD
jgi:hypothetical protein